MKKYIFSIIIVALSAIGLKAQELTIIPNVSSLKEKQDYVDYKGAIPAMVDWLSENEVNYDIDKRNAIYNFIINWSKGSPTITLFFGKQFQGEFIMTPLLRAEYVAGCSKYSVENSIKKMNYEMHSAGMNHLLDFYELNKKHLDDNKELNKLLKMRKSGKLEKLMETQIENVEKTIEKSQLVIE